MEREREREREREVVIDIRLMDLRIPKTHQLMSKIIGYNFERHWVDHHSDASHLISIGNRRLHIEFLDSNQNKNEEGIERESLVMRKDQILLKGNGPE